MKRVFLMLPVILLVFTGQANAKKFNTASLKGSYIYQFAGTSSTSGNISETGIFTADGKGHFTAVAETAINGSPEASHTDGPVWDCDYTVAPNGFVAITCDRTDFEFEGITWTMVIDGKKKDVKFQASGDQPGFGTVDFQGSGTRQ